MLDAKETGSISKSAVLKTTVFSVLMGQALLFAMFDRLNEGAKDALGGLKDPWGDDDKKKKKPSEGFLTSALMNLASGMPMANVYQSYVGQLTAALKGDRKLAERYERLANVGAIPPLDSVQRHVTKMISSAAKETEASNKYKDGKISRRELSRTLMKIRGETIDTAIEGLSEAMGLPTYWANRYIHAGPNLMNGLDRL
jgi:hypothetical protein